MYYRAFLVTSRTANASLPSTLVLAIPKEMALGITPSEAYCYEVGVEIANLLFLHKNIV